MNKEMKIVCLGDSITWGFPLGPRYSWVHMLAETLQVQILNKGVNGDTTSGMYHRFDRDVLAHNPSHVIIMGGANDVVFEDPLESICWNYREMANKAQKAGITVIIGLPTPIDDDYYEKPLSQLRNWLKEFVKENQYKFIDFPAAFYDDQGSLKTELLIANSGHPAITGYQEMFKQIDISIFSQE